MPEPMTHAPMTDEELLAQLSDRDLDFLEQTVARSGVYPHTVVALIREVRRLRSALSQAEAAHGEAVRTAVAGEKERAAKIADAYAAELIRMAGDTVLHDPILHGGDVSAAAVEKSDRLVIEGAQHSASYHTAQHIAVAIRSRSHPVPDGV